MLSKKNIALFKSSKVKAIKYTNSRNYDTMVIKENIGEMNSYLMDILLDLFFYFQNWFIDLLRKDILLFN